MAEKQVITRVRNRIDTTARWSYNNPVLAKGEIGIATGTTYGIPVIKIGDGVTAWNELPYIDANYNSYPITWETQNAGRKGDGEAGLKTPASEYTETIVSKPFLITWDGKPVKMYNASGDSNSTTYVALPTTADTAHTASIYINSGAPIGALVSAQTLNAKIGTSNISSAVWTTREYAINADTNYIGPYTLQLSTVGNVITQDRLIVSDSDNYVSYPIYQMDITVQTTTAQELRIFGADLTTTFTASERYYPLLAYNNPYFATREFVYDVMHEALEGVENGTY